MGGIGSIGLCLPWRRCVQLKAVQQNLVNLVLTHAIGVNKSCDVNRGVPPYNIERSLLLTELSRIHMNSIIWCPHKALKSSSATLLLRSIGSICILMPEAANADRWSWKFVHLQKPLQPSNSKEMILALWCTVQRSATDSFSCQTPELQGPFIEFIYT